MAMTTKRADELACTMNAIDTALLQGVQSIYKPYEEIWRVSDFAEYVPVAHWDRVMSDYDDATVECYLLWANGIAGIDELASMSDADRRALFAQCEQDCSFEVVYFTEADETGEM